MNNALYASLPPLEAAKRRYLDALASLPTEVQEALKNDNLEQVRQLLLENPDIDVSKVQEALRAKKEYEEQQEREQRETERKRQQAQKEAERREKERQEALERVQKIEQEVLDHTIYGKQVDGLKKLRTHIAKLSESLGLSGVSIENFGRKIDSLSIDTEQAARSVEELGKSLIELREQIAKQRQGYWQAREEAQDSFEALKKKAIEQHKTYLNELTAVNNKAYKTAAENVRQFLSSLQSASNTLGSLIDRLSTEVGGAQYSQRLFYKALSQAKEALSAKNFDKYTKAIKDMSNSIGFLDTKHYTSVYEARYEKAVVLNQLRSLKSPTDIIIEQLKQINKNTQASAEHTSKTAQDIYKLVNVQLGGRDFEEIVANGIVQGIKTDDLAAVIGGNSQTLIAQLEQSNAKWDKFPIANGKMLVTADFDKDGVNDIAFGIDASGKIASIDTATASTFSVLENSFGDVNVKEVFLGDRIQSLFGKDWAIAIGDSLNLINETLESLGAQIDTFGHNLYVDVDQDGVWDFRLTADETGHLEAIDAHTSQTVNAILSNFRKSAQKVGVDTSNVTHVSTAEEIALAEYGTRLYQAADKYMHEASPNFMSIYKQYGYKNYDEILQINPQDAEKYKQYLLEAYDYAKQASDFAKRIIEADAPGGIDLRNYPSGLSAPYDTIGAVAGMADKVKEYLHRRHIPGFAAGGYTGDIPPTVVAGVVHGREFVINAPTTRRLGLNRDNGGVFMDILKELREVKKESAELRAVVTKHLPNVDYNTKKDAHTRIA